MFGFVISPALKIAAAFIGLVLLFSFGYYKGYSNEKQKFDTYKAEVAALAKAQENNTKRIIQTQEQITKKAEIKHEKDISSLRAIYDRMRNTASGSSVSTVPNTTTNPAEATSYYLAIAPELATQCGETTQQVVNLQTWVNEQQELK